MFRPVTCHFFQIISLTECSTCFCYFNRNILDESWTIKCKFVNNVIYSLIFVFKRILLCYPSTWISLVLNTTSFQPPIALAKPPFLKASLHIPHYLTHPNTNLISLIVAASTTGRWSWARQCEGAWQRIRSPPYYGSRTWPPSTGA